MAPARQGHHGDPGGGQPLPPTLPSMEHAGAAEGPEWYTPLQSTVQIGSRE